MIIIIIIPFVRCVDRSKKYMYIYNLLNSVKPQMLSLRVLLIQFFIPFREIVGAIGMTEPGMTSFSPTSYIV